MSLDPSADPLPVDPHPADSDDAPHRARRDASGPRRSRRDVDRFPRAPHVPGSSGGAVVWVAVALIVALLVAAGFWPAQLNAAAGVAMQWVTTTGGWSLLLIPLCLI
ncbi:MAG: glycine/betaine ABC transporter permease, partial [Brachybacterium tyrofermentans]